MSGAGIPWLVIAAGAAAIAGLLLWVWFGSRPSAADTPVVDLPPRHQMVPRPDPAKRTEPIAYQPPAFRPEPFAANPIRDSLRAAPEARQTGVPPPPRQQPAAAPNPVLPPSRAPIPNLTMEYFDADGVVTQRAVTVSRVSGEYTPEGFEPHRLSGYCHLRGEPRTFLARNIIKMSDPMAPGQMLTEPQAIAGALRILHGPSSARQEDWERARSSLEAEEAKRTVPLNPPMTVTIEWRANKQSKGAKTLEAEIIACALGEEQRLTSFVARALKGRRAEHRYYAGNPVPLVRVLAALTINGVRLEGDNIWPSLIAKGRET